MRSRLIQRRPTDGHDEPRAVTLIIEACRSSVHVVGIGECGSPDGPPWVFTAYEPGTLRVVLARPIFAHDGDCAVEFVEALDRHLTATGTRLHAIICDNQIMFHRASFRDACRARAITVDHRPAVRRNRSRLAVIVKRKPNSSVPRWRVKVLSRARAARQISDPVGADKSGSHDD